MSKPQYWLTIPLLFAVGCAKSPAPQQTAFQPDANPAGTPAALTPAPSDPVKPSSLSPMGSAGAEEQARRAVVIPRGTTIRVRLADSLSTTRNRAGDAFSATLDDPIEVDGQTVVPKGTTFNGHVVNAYSSGRLRGRADLGIELDSFVLNGKNYRISTSDVNRASASHKKRNALLIGGGTGFGALVGALAGGGKGALIGAGAGAAAGTAGAAFTGRRQVGLPVETRLAFRLEEPVRL